MKETREGQRRRKCFWALLAGDPRRLAARFKLSAADTWAPPVTDLGSNLILRYCLFFSLLGTILSYCQARALTVFVFVWANFGTFVS